MLDLRGGLTDQDPHDPFALLTGKTLSVIGVEEKLHQAAADDAIAGLLVRLPEASTPPAAADELRQAFLRFRAAKKPILAFSQGLYASGSVASTYELGAATGDLWMQPGAPFQVTGYSRGDVFFKRLFDKYGVVADYQQREQYKTAINPYLHDDYTPAHRLSELSWITSVYSSAVGAAAFDRHHPVDGVRTTLEAGPYGAEDALAKGLIDHVGDIRQASLAINKTVGGNAEFLRMAAYEPTEHEGGPTIAVIQAEGAIQTGEGPSAPNPLSGGAAIRSDDIAKAFHAAIRRRCSQGHRVPNQFSRGIGHRFGADPRRGPRRPCGGQTGGGQHGDLWRVRWLLDLQPGR